MNTQLNPVTFFKLQAFAKRRNRLITVRGMCAVVVTALLVMTAIAFVDFFFVLPDWARIALSLTGYALIFGVLYVTWLRWFLRRADLDQLARMFESGHDELKEKILSAVELGRPAPKEVRDSEELRRLFQKRVAVLIKEYKLKALLPASLVRRWPIIAAAVIVLCIALAVIPGLKFPQLMARAFIPIANIARVSSLAIDIVEPTDPEPTIPRGDPLTIVARLSRPSEHAVFMESFAENGEPDIVQMEPIGKQQYSATVVVARESLTYRVFAQKASTRQYTVLSAPRPHVTRFHKTYHYPPYSLLKDKQIAETTGDLKALQSSTVDLNIEVDQPVTAGELRIQIGEKKKTIKLTAAAPMLLRAKVDIVESGTYRVHLTAKKTKFENKFAPNYEIVALADLVPDVTLEKPTQSLILPPDQIVRVEGAAADDLGLRSVEQLVRVNRGPWDRTTLASDPCDHYHIKRNWDLLPLDLKPGDQVSTKLVATDLKGNTGESLIAQITISSPGFSSEHLENSKLRNRVQQSLHQLAELSKQLNKDYQALKQQFNNAPKDVEKLRSASLKAQVSAEQLQRSAEAAFEAIEDATHGAQTRRESEDMILLGRMISKLQHDNLAGTQAYRRPLASNRPPSREQMDRAAQAAVQVEGTANHAYQASKTIVALQQARDAAREAARLRDDQAEMLRQAKEDAQAGEEDIKQNAPRRLARRETAAAKEQQILEQMLDGLAEHVEYNQSRKAQSLREKLEEQRGRIEETLKEKDPGSKLAERGNETQNMLKDTANQLGNIERNLHNRAANERHRLNQSLALSANELAQLKWKVDDLARKQTKLQELQAKPNVNAQELSRQREQTAQASELAEHRWGSAAGQLKDRAKLEDVKATPTYRFVADTADTAAAVEALHATATDPEQVQQSAKALNEIEKAYRMLETGHDLLEANKSLNEMAAEERWDFAQADAISQPLNDWDFWEKDLKTLPNQLKAAGLPDEIRTDLSKVFNSEPFRSVGAESRQRRNPSSKRKPVAPQMDLVAQSLAVVSEKIEPYMAEARKVIAEYAPSLVDQLKAVSKLAEQAEAQTNDLTAKAEEQGADETRSQAAGLLDEQRQLNDHLDTIRDSLRRDANIQDLSDAEGRERARDADDALAMLRQPPPKAEDLLEQAVRSSQTESQQHALEQAADQQEKLSDALNLIAEHYENLDAGNPEQTRLALRQAEEDAALAQNMDSQYDRLNELAQMAQTAPDELKALLEKELVQNEPMQNEMQQIVDSTLQQAASDLSEMTNRENNISEKLDKITVRQDRKDPQLSQISNKIGELTKKAQQLAAKAENLAHNKVSQAAKKSSEAGAKAQQQFNDAKESLKEGDRQIPKAATASPAELAEKVDSFAKSLDKARNDLNQAAEKTQSTANDQKRDQANQASQMAREAGREAQDLSNQARQIADELEDLGRRQNAAQQQLAKAPGPAQNKFADKAKNLARKAEHLAQQRIPQAAKKADEIGAKASENFDSAAQAAGDAAQQIPSDFSGRPDALAEKVDDFVDAMDQARNDLTGAIGKVNSAPGSTPAQRTQARNQARNAQQEALNLSKQARDLARGLRDLDRRHAVEFEHTDRQQAEINDMAPGVIDDLARAAIHAERLGRPDAQAMQQSSQAMQGISQNELPQAQSALDDATHARQAHGPVDQAHDALAEQLENLNELQPAAGQAAQSMQGPAQAAASDEIATWMARTLDRLEAAQMAQGAMQQAQASQQAAAQQATANRQAQQAMSQTLQAQQGAMAQARAQAQAQAQSRAQARNRMSSMFSSDTTSSEMPPETGLELPEYLRLRPGDWGKLRKLSARDLMEARKETVAEDYRKMVNTYFLVISQKAKQKK